MAGVSDAENTCPGTEHVYTACVVLKCTRDAWRGGGGALQPIGIRCRRKPLSG